MKYFVCPYCRDYELRLAEHIVCPRCYGEMRSVPVTDIEYQINLNKLQDLYVGVLHEKGDTQSKVKLIAPIGTSSKLFQDIHAVFPVNGMGRKWPLTFACRQSWESEIWLFQPHPQTDKPFTRFFEKGLLYSGMGNAIAFALFNPPVWMFWASTFIFAGVYFFFSRKITVTGSERRESLEIQKIIEGVNDESS